MADQKAFPSPADDYAEDSIDLNRELVPSPMSTSHLIVVGDAMRGIGLYDGDLVLYDRAKLPTHGRCVVAIYEGEVIVQGQRKVAQGGAWSG